ncbi:hypothetical protein BDK51DRAFT_32838 [Blyttiomyces helicus]|uniref:Uncharacterized protein n=1 Tax=Blyttiomyces helicus TaxID=388810 RepID=A0A4P9W9Q7_9FUNG|nr:hypothetical protein BDK51DRAFT_32838 [Blyttiomyces helicus]|eukprot:RKO86956.1 hypothetical protein BDK51DRAFT_32838 [Blyttiomyces helicus]
MNSVLDALAAGAKSGSDPASQRELQLLVNFRVLRCGPSKEALTRPVPLTLQVRVEHFQLGLHISALAFFQPKLSLGDNGQVARRIALFEMRSGVNQGSLKTLKENLAADVLDSTPKRSTERVEIEDPRFGEAFSLVAHCEGIILRVKLLKTVTTRPNGAKLELETDIAPKQHL